MGAEFGEGAEEVGKTSRVGRIDVPAVSQPHVSPRFRLTYWHSHIGNKVPVYSSRVPGQ